MPFNFTEGSNDSIQFLQGMMQRGPTHAYLSDTAQAFVLHKFNKIHTIGLVKLALYLLYLICLNAYNEKWVMISFLIYFAAMNVIKLTTKTITVWDQLNFWVVFDFSRILFLISYVWLSYTDNNYALLVNYFLLTIQSWMGLLENLRIFDMYQFMLTLIFKSIKDLRQYFCALVIMY